MKIFVPNVNFIERPHREAFLKLLSTTVTLLPSVVPHRSVPGNNNLWTIDDQDDWRVNFLHRDKNAVEITYLHEAGKPSERALCEWLVVRFGVKILE